LKSLNGVEVGVMAPSSDISALPVVSRFAWAEAYPTRPVRIIAVFAPGGPADIIARLMSQFLSETARPAIPRE
jgi:tripartite-type tricarboxylate transporter receptor subunit TctC